MEAMDGAKCSLHKVTGCMTAFLCPEQIGVTLGTTLPEHRLHRGWFSITWAAKDLYL